MNTTKHMIIQRGDLRPIARNKPIASIKYSDLRDELRDMGYYAETIILRDGSATLLMKDRYGAITPNA